MYNSVWFSDLRKALDAFQRDCPNEQTFEKIEGTIAGNFLIKTSTNEYIVSHTNFEVYRKDR